jgi:hypothetical protein
MRSLGSSSAPTAGERKSPFAKAIRVEDKWASRNPPRLRVEWGKPAEVTDASTDM